MKHLTKNHVQKNIWVPSSVAVGICVGFVSDADTVAFVLLLCIVATAWWSVYYWVRNGRGDWRA